MLASSRQTIHTSIITQLQRSIEQLLHSLIQHIYPIPVSSSSSFLLQALGQETLQRPHRAADAVRVAVSRRMPSLVSILSQATTDGVVAGTDQGNSVFPSVCRTGPGAAIALRAAEPLSRAGLTLSLLVEKQPAFLLRAVTALVGGTFVNPGHAPSTSAAPGMPRYPLSPELSHASEAAMDFLIALLGEAGARLDEHENSGSSIGGWSLGGGGGELRKEKSSRSMRR